METNPQAEPRTIEPADDETDGPKTTASVRLVLCYAAACGILVGFAEVVWSYRLPDINPMWRAVLPASFGGLFRFLAIAGITDTLLFCAIALLFVGIARALRRIEKKPAPVRDRSLRIRWWLIATALSYLSVGWLCLFVLMADEFSDPAFWGPLLGAVAASSIVALLIAAILGWLRRRVHRSMPTICFGLALAAAFLAVIPAFGRYGASLPPPHDVPYTPKGLRHPVVLITLDTLRCDYLSCYGNTWIHTPVLDALASDGVLFEQAISQSPTTTPSHCSIMTSLYPNVHDAWNGKPMKRGLLTLADVFRANGFPTAAFTSATTTRSINSGLQEGFDLYNDSLVPWASWFSRDEFQNLILFYLLGISQDSQIRGHVVTDRFIDWLGDNRDDAFFVWLHYFDPHDPWDAPGEYYDKYAGMIDDGLPMREERERYAGEIEYTDHQLGIVFDALKRRGLYDNTLIVIAADHGEAFGEKHWEYTDVSHGDHLYDTTQRVPLIVKPPLGFEPGRRIDEQVELIDIAPTILAMMWIEIPDAFSGKPLHELIEGRPYSYAGSPAYSTTWVAAEDNSPNGGAMFVQLMSNRSPDWKYIYLSHFEQEELYDLKRDPEETRNVSKTNPRITGSRKTPMKEKLEQAHDAFVDPRAKLAPHLLRQLQGLGYLRGSADEEKKDD